VSNFAISTINTCGNRYEGGITENLARFYRKYGDNAPNVFAESVRV